MANDLTPAAARQYIEVFSKHTLPGTDHVQFGDGTTVNFSTMTNEDAVRVARGLMSIEAEAAGRSDQRKS